MEKPIALEHIFKDKVFRIPDYQRGYAWQPEQFTSFWEDLVNLNSTHRAHYMGVLTLKLAREDEIARDANEFWLVANHSYSLYHVVDGQQRLTTAVVCIQAFVEFFRYLPEHEGKKAAEIYVYDSLTIAHIEEKYLFQTNPLGGFRTYKFGYSDLQAQEYLRYRVFSEAQGSAVQETFYTLNLGNAKTYFYGQIAALFILEGHAGLEQLFKKLTKQLMFNQYIIEDEFDVFVAFETMNNRGKKLSDLELLKNRLIYLSTLYTDNDLDQGGRKSIRDDINSAWREVYYQLGRNKTKPLNDDDFLRAHWISYFKYSRNTGRDYARFLLDQQFTPKRLLQALERDVSLDAFEEQRSEVDADEAEEEVAIANASLPNSSLARRLSVKEVRDYVTSLRASANHWFDTFYPFLSSTLSSAEMTAVDRLNRIGMGYFRPLVMVVLTQDHSQRERVALFEKIERFIFVAFRLGSSRSNYRSSEFFILARSLNRGESTVHQISERLDVALADSFTEGGTLRTDEFRNTLFKKFKDGSGYYGWSGLRYFLYEYEQELLSQTRQEKVGWSDLLKSSGDKISIEHIYPQTPTSGWEGAFADLSEQGRARYSGSLGNLLLLSMSINSSLQNISFDEKKSPKIDDGGNKVRNGYADGSHSEIEVARLDSWGPGEIRARGLRLLEFMERRWNFSLEAKDKETLLFLDL